MAKPNPNKNWITSKQGGKTINRLDVERMPDPTKVRLVWTRYGVVEADEMIDVSGFPEFDIWARQVVSDKAPAVVVFRYGNFKDCSVEDDDRDLVYVALAWNRASVSASPPQDVKIGTPSNLPKRIYIGQSIKSAKYGCRRTYDADTGAFGLEKLR